jgi:hypothetical protein
MKLDGERFFKRSMVVLLTRHPKTCSLVTLFTNLFQQLALPGVWATIVESWKGV